ncbi:MAG: hypothetical protein ACI4PR_03645 [Acutalibacteraceae bacterium]
MKQMKHFPTKFKFSGSKFLVATLWIASFIGIIFFPKTFSTYYTLYGFSDKFLSAQKYSGYSNTLYADFLSSGDTSTKTFGIVNTSEDSESNYQYIRAVYIESLVAEFNDSSYVYVPSRCETSTISPYASRTSNAETGLDTDKWFKNGDWYYYKTPLPTGENGEIKLLDLKKITECSDTTCDKFYTTFIVESLPVNADDDEFQSAWGVSKTELESLGLNSGTTE